ncbi:TFIIB-type zinc ribbon-containing protein [Govanella unica]|uniref:Zf-TFIIB domain-containing protein n=1 Tax=Govanella unica TaxID=2975056 RepID=A0A9X3TWJ4_9PROT|nr:zf-TFIIB domain-containing protein [Govania unica]MDA5193251.1 zf-TFIIB domain-containing protein [Govania unica]
MKCPIDDSDLVMSERQGIEIDYCPTCRGVWLDRGELDKIIERSAGTVVGGPRYEAPDPGVRQEPGQSYLEDYRRATGYDKSYEEKPYPKKKKSFLDDIFDF